MRNCSIISIYRYPIAADLAFTKKTPAQVKADLRKDGKTIAQWAKENGYTRRQVYAVLNGQIKGHFGRSHEIAKKLGLKAVAQAA